MHQGDQMVTAFFLVATAGAVGTGAGRRVKQTARALMDDWRGSRMYFFGLLLLVIAGVAVASMYLYQPTQPEFSYDTASYLAVTQKFLSSGQIVDPLRTPGYPLLVALVFLVAGTGNFFAVSLVQALLFLAATLEIYLLALLIFRRSEVAFLVGVLVGTNTYFLTFIKPIIVEGLALWLTVSLALVLVLYVRRGSLRYFWLAALLALALFLTRPEWMYLPIPLFALLLLFAARRGQFRRVLPHAIAATLLLYSVLGVCILINATQNGYAGYSYVQNINLVGKVIQYHMEGEASPEYAAVAKTVSDFTASGDLNPYNLAYYHPEISANHWALGGAYASSIIKGHPLEFAAKTVLTFFTASNGYRIFSAFDASGPVATPPLRVQVAFSAHVAFAYRFFPLFALFWGVAFFWRRFARFPMVEALAVVCFICLYELAVTTLGGYSDYDYARIHIPFDPLLIVVIWGSVLAVPLPKAALARLARRWPQIRLVALALIACWLVLSIIVAGFRHGLRSMFNPYHWPGAVLVSSHPYVIFLAILLAWMLAWPIYHAWRDQRERKRAAVAQKQQAEQAAEDVPLQVRG